MSSTQQNCANTNRHIQFDINGERYVTGIRNSESVASSNILEPRHSCPIQYVYQNNNLNMATNGLAANVYYGAILSEPTTSRIRDVRPHSAYHTINNGKVGFNEDRKYNSDVEVNDAIIREEVEKNSGNFLAKRGSNPTEKLRLKKHIKEGWLCNDRMKNLLENLPLTFIIFEKTLLIILIKII